MEKPKLSIIMPVYNARDIKSNVNEAINELNKLGVSYEIILSNDGSTNSCFEEAKKIKDPHLKVVGYEKNQGKGNAIKYGFRFTKGEYVAFVDSGRDINPKQIGDFIKTLEEKKADIVIGSKRHKESKVRYPLARRIMSRAYQFLNYLLFNLSLTDTQVGIKLFKHPVLEEIMPKIAIKRFAFDLELLVLAKKYKFKIVEAPVTIRYQFGSTINLKSVFWMLWDTAAIFYRDKILHYYN